MAQSLSEASGEGYEIKIGDRVLKLSPITMKSMAAFEQWCRRRIMQQAKEMLPDLPRELQADILAQAQRDAAACTFQSPRGLAMMQSLDGIAQMLYLACEKTNPEIKSGEAMLEVIGAVPITELLQGIAHASGLVGLDGDRRPTQPPASSPTSGS